MPAMTDELCRTLAEQAIKSDPDIEKLLNTIAEAERKKHGPDWRGPALSCRRCGSNGPEANARAFCSTEPWALTLCSNRLADLGDIREVLRHELVHIFDFSTKRYDYESCSGLAASEIRAAREAECSGKFTFGFMRDRCIQRTAVASTANIFPDDASRCVKDMFDKAMADLEPLRDNSAPSSR